MHNQLYDLYEGEERIGQHTVPELAERFGLCVNTVRVYISAGRLFGGRYHAERAVTEELAEEWDELCKAVRRRGGGDREEGD